MSITARSLKAAVAEWAEDLEFLLHATVTHGTVARQYLDFQRGKPTLVTLTLRRSGGAPGVKLVSRKYKTPFFLFIGQHLVSDVTDDGAHILRTVKYRYGLAFEDDGDAIIRWDYVRSPSEGDVRCRHHFQGTSEVVIRNQRMALNEFHLPTGYVPVEEVLRFCIADLDVKPINPDWDTLLTGSYDRFRSNLRCPKWDTCSEVEGERQVRGRG